MSHALLVDGQRAFVRDGENCIVDNGSTNRTGMTLNKHGLCNLRLTPPRTAKHTLAMLTP